MNRSQRHENWPDWKLSAADRKRLMTVPKRSQLARTLIVWAVLALIVMGAVIHYGRAITAFALNH